MLYLFKQDDLGNPSTGNHKLVGKIRIDKNNMKSNIKVFEIFQHMM